MNSWPLSAVETEMRRLKVLQYLESVPSYEAAATVLGLHCRRIGVPTTSDQVVACISWLADMELVAVRVYRDEPIARITKQGRDVATGNTAVPGVLRPDP